MLRRDVISLSLKKSPVLRAGALSDEVLTLVDKAASRECTGFMWERACSRKRWINQCCMD
ncbi:hypothetical protein EMIT0347P_20483 [Pseudomonas sp. IT-347P]